MHTRPVQRLVVAAAAAALLVGPAAGSAQAASTGTSKQYVCAISNPCAAGAAGSVRLARSGAKLTVTRVMTKAGWAAHVERRTGLQPEVTFRKGAARVDFSAEVEDGRVRVTVRTR